MNKRQIDRAVFIQTDSSFIDKLGLPAIPVYPKREIFRMLLLLAWERGEWSWSGRLSELLSKP